MNLNDLVNAIWEQISTLESKVGAVVGPYAYPGHDSDAAHPEKLAHTLAAPGAPLLVPA
jgi:hypothetical protein